MPEISLTQFVDFVVKAGTAQLSEVRRIKRQHARGYHPARDYWCKMRDGIVDMHKDGHDKAKLDALVRSIHDANKKNTYPPVAQAYKKFMGRKSFDWFEPVRGDWKHEDLIVRVNPELGLSINGEPHLVKLYFKEQKLTADRIAAISYMMLDVLQPKARQAKVALLDVRNGKLYPFETADPALVHLLEGQALNFCRMYQGV